MEAALPPRLLPTEIAARVALILANLAAIVARRFLRDPRHVALIVPRWTRLNRMAQYAVTGEEPLHPAP